MADITQIQVGSTTYNIKDETARISLSTKANITDVYTTTQINTALNLKAPISSPAFTDIPTAPTATTGTNTTQIATTQFVQNAFSNYTLPIATTTTVGGLIDAPFNDKQYGRKNGIWEEISKNYYIALTTSVKSILTEESISIKQINSWSTGILPTLGNEIIAINDISFSTGVLPTFTIEDNGLVISQGVLPGLISTTVAIPNITDIGTLPELISEDKIITNVTTTTQVVAVGISEINL